MNKELTEKLFAKYPAIFADRTKPMTQSLVCFGFEFGDGWYDLMDALCNKLQFVANLTGVQPVAIQMKEKFAGLRFYCHNRLVDDFPKLSKEQIAIASDIINGIITQAEELSERTCDVCGVWAGIVKYDNWDYVLCDTHHAELIISRIAGHYPVDSGTALTLQQKLDKLRIDGLCYVTVGAFTPAHLSAAGMKELSDFEAFLPADNKPAVVYRAQLDLMDLWFVMRSCAYTSTVMKLLGVPASLIADIDIINDMVESQQLYAVDKPNLCEVALAIMKWSIRAVEQDYNKRRYE